MRPYGWALILLDWYPYRNRLEYRHREKTMWGHNGKVGIYTSRREDIETNPATS